MRCAQPSGDGRVCHVGRSGPIEARGIELEDLGRSAQEALVVDSVRVGERAVDVEDHEARHPTACVPPDREP